jgi:hypothetical protein
MTRHYSSFANHSVRSLLDILADKQTAPHRYKEAMSQLGESLGESILPEIKSDQSSIYLACTVEDADFLAKGILNRLEDRIKSVAFACFWNHRFSPFEIEDIAVAPILKKYQEPSGRTVNYLIVVKSIISGACVVKTNLMNLIQKIEPDKIFIVAPVMYYQAEEKLKNEFDEDVYDKFKFFYFAQDDERTAEGEVIPGIGGMIYQRLGFEGQEDKNQYVPEIVKSRRSRFVEI